MAIDQLTALLGFNKQGTGNNNNTWGENLNLALERADQAIAGVVDVSVTGQTAITLNDAQALANVVTLSGNLSADCTITVPNTSRVRRMVNNATGNFAVLAKASGSGLLVNVPFGKPVDLLTVAGTLIRGDVDAIGEVFFTARASIPVGAFECSGQYLKRASYPSLYAAIGTFWGNQDSTDFRLPNLSDTSRFIRARGISGYAAGSYQGNQMIVHSHSGSGTTTTESVTHNHSGSGNTGGMNASNPHSHGIPSHGSINVQGGPNAIDVVTGTAQTDQTNIDHGHPFSFATGTQSAFHTHSYSFTTNAVGTGSETRPEGVVMYSCIRY